MDRSPRKRAVVAHHRRHENDAAAQTPPRVVPVGDNADTIEVDEQTLLGLLTGEDIDRQMLIDNRLHANRTHRTSLQLNRLLLDLAKKQPPLVSPLLVLCMWLGVVFLLVLAARKKWI
jgi:hypothetical protein